ncbi:hypothetical protein NQ317_012976 [Molorchus minor]|uniref:THAP-type domain-containing protein n=1 Tax=Molorchus minor TaxID=1323400 RepID=A0ABQ9JHH0_9CUCU|nr:hypothetical protein NQ317_012976 [Molorchus minor]
MNKRRKTCAVPGCDDQVSSRHRFPINDDNTFKIWKAQVNHPRFEHLTAREIYNNYFVCHRHFGPDTFVIGTKRGLKVGSVPTLYLPNRSAAKPSSTQSVTEQDKVDDCIPPPIKKQKYDIYGEGTSSSAVFDQVVDGEDKLTPDTTPILHQIIDTPPVVLPTRGKEMCRKDVGSRKYILKSVQVKNQMLPPRGRRFTLDEKVLALTLMKSSGKGYRLLSKIFALPSRQTLTNLLNKIPLKPGINTKLFNTLKDSVMKMCDKEKYCILIFDELAIDANIQYNKRYDCIEGIEDYGTERSNKVADHANVFMIKGALRNWIQPISFSFSNGPAKTDKLVVSIKMIIKECQRIGLKVIASVCDQGAANVAAINRLLAETKSYMSKKGEENKHHGYLINDQEIIPLYDVPHLFKGLRNNLLTKKSSFFPKWKGNDISEDVRICPKLTDNHVIPEKINKMKVSACTQVFSNTVGSLMKRISKWNLDHDRRLSTEAEDTAELILFLDKLFDSLNAINRIAPSSKPLKGAVTENSPHEEFWRSAITIPPSVSNLIKTLNGFIFFKKSLTENEKIILNIYYQKKFNQDNLENFFSYVRSHSARYTSPDVAHFISSFKALLINNFMSSHSPFSNCEESELCDVLDNLQSYLTGEDIAGVTSLQDNDITLAVPSNIINIKRSRIGRCTITYVTGYFVRKAIQIVKDCEFCKANYLYSDYNKDHDFIEAREYTNSRLIRPGSFVTYVTGIALSVLFYLLPRTISSFNLAAMLKNQLIKYINFNPLICPEHKDVKNVFLNTLVKCIIYFYTKQVNRILKGKDTKFAKYVAVTKDKVGIDPFKLHVHQKYLSKTKK